MIKVNTVVGGMVATNCYVVENDKRECLVIDIAEHTGGKIVEFIVGRGLTPLAILVTHGHFDHTLGITKFQQSFPLEVYGNAADNGMKLRIFPKAYSFVTHDVADGELLAFGDFKVKVMHTPGHSAGSVCYLIEDCLFSGDTLFKGDIGRTDFEGGNVEQMAESLKKICALEGDYKVYPGHMKSSTLDLERKNNRSLRF